MAKMKRVEAKTIRSIYGHSVYFPGGDAEVYVPPILHAAALEAGAVFVEDVDVKEHIKAEDTKKALASDAGPVEPAEREAAILAAVRVIADNNQSGDFTAGGLPKTAVVAKYAKFRVDPVEVRAAWESYTQEPFKEA